MLKSSASISVCLQYRYSLARRWSEGQRWALWIMLNPSTADAEKDDATIRKVTKFSKAWNMDALEVNNLFPYRATQPRDLYNHAEPHYVRDTNYDVIGDSVLRKPEFIICAWGQHGNLLDRARIVVAMLRTFGAPLHYLKMGKNGMPWHPLYIPDATQPQLWEPT